MNERGICRLCEPSKKLYEYSFNVLQVLYPSTPQRLKEWILEQ